MMWRHFGGETFEPSVFYIGIFRFDDKSIPPILIETVIYNQKYVHSFVDTIFLANSIISQLQDTTTKTLRCFGTLSCLTITKTVFDLNRIVFIRHFFSFVFGTFSSVSFSEWPSFDWIVVLYTHFHLFWLWIASLDEIFSLNCCSNAIACGVVDSEMYMAQ